MPVVAHKKHINISIRTHPQAMHPICINKNSFSQRTLNEWNILSADCVDASSVNMFKNKIDMYLRRAGYI